MSSSQFKDHFSTSSDQYQRYRPGYPEALFEYLAGISPARELAWDCATGTGQAARELARLFTNVVASDASTQQIAQAERDDRIDYRVMPAEQPALAAQSVDLITVAQALHWFDQARFYNAAWEILKPDGVLAVWSYKLLSVNPAIDKVVKHFYHDIVGPYWPQERKLIEQGYPPLPKLFNNIETPMFAMQSEWSASDLLGYLGTWSASRYYQAEQGTDPLDQIREELLQAWGDGDTIRLIHWPLHIRVGKKQDNKHVTT
jgi:SAM-dependent methyltransferase